MRAKSMTIVRLAALAVLVATSVGVIPVYAATHCVNPGGTGGCYSTIQAAIDAATDGDTINILPGTYTGTANIVSRANLRLQGSGAGVTVLQPTSTLPWNIWGYAATRTAVIRIVNSTNIVIDGITLDMNAVKGNWVFGSLVANSTGALSHSLLKNNQVPESAGGYYEFGMRVEAKDAPYNDSNRAAFSITDNTFQDVGRVALNVHGWVNLTIARNTIMKSPGAADFGYGVELGSVSIGSITDNVFHGFDTPAASDGSTSAGLYIENAFTGSGGSYPTTTPAVAKNVTVANNEFSGNQYGAWIGNEYAGYAGNVDIAVAFTNNKVHNNLKSGVYVADEGRDAGSSVTITGSGNQITNNEIGYEFFTYGNGELHAALSKETITGNTGTGGDGIKVEYNTVIGTSLYDVSITQSKISGNSPYGIEAMAGISVAATNNWWGSAAGPGSGNNDVSGNVTTSPYAHALASSATASTHELGESGSLTTTLTVDGLYGVQLVVTHNPSILTFASGTMNDLTAFGWYWDQVIHGGFWASPGRTELSSSMQQRASSANLSNTDLAVWRYTCTGVGTSALAYDTTANTGSYLSDQEGFNIPAAWLGDSITCVAATGSAQGSIQLQGRLQNAAHPAGWNDAIVTFTCTGGGCTGFSPYVFVTGVDGAYQLLKSGPGTGMAQGTYNVTVSRRAYLGASRNNVTVDSGTLSLSTPKLLGGDITGDGTVEIGDLTEVGGAYGTPITPDTGSDINGDGFVNIFDLVLVGSNYNLTSSTW